MDTIRPELRDASIPDVKALHRGVWAERLVNNQELPVGGFITSKELTTKLKLDFEKFDEETERFTEENIRALFEQTKEALIKWLEQVGSDVDPYLFFVVNQVQSKMQKLLEVDPKQPDQPAARRTKYSGSSTPNLSDFKGATMCTERAAMGQYLLQRAGIESAYVGGITMTDAKDNEEWPEDHSYLVVKDPNKKESSYIFDIARPRSQQNLARLLKPSVPFDYDLLKDKEELLVRAREVLQGGELWFGVGDSVAGQHEVIE